eukprot:15367024-Ditylum_brightwellii.AAC.1
MEFRQCSTDQFAWKREDITVILYAHGHVITTTSNKVLIKDIDWLQKKDGHIIVYVWEATESGAHVWATALGSNPGQPVHFSGGEKKVDKGRLYGV